MTEDDPKKPTIPENQYPPIAMAVYQACLNYDPYLPESREAMVRAWAKVFFRFQLTLNDLTAAVDKLYAERESGFKPLPADIANAARALRHDRRQREEVTAASRPALTDEEAERAARARIEAIKALAAEKKLELEEKPAQIGSAGSATHLGGNPLAIACSWCRASAGSPCVSPATGLRLTQTPYHPARVEAAKKLVGAE
ncbi:hypothetical protein PBI_HILLTOPFARM_81 [Mycobacterium phage Hilltopfarm]|nr:hypothetical protein PBI_HILLTOPFARM_81 [Mycobacterium phage Hilltopfarm]